MHLLLPEHRIHGIVQVNWQGFWRRRFVLDCHRHKIFWNLRFVSRQQAVQLVRKDSTQSLRKCLAPSSIIQKCFYLYDWVLIQNYIYFLISLATISQLILSRVNPLKSAPTLTPDERNS